MPFPLTSLFHKNILSSPTIEHPVFHLLLCLSLNAFLKFVTSGVLALKTLSQIQTRKLKDDALLYIYANTSAGLLKLSNNRLYFSKTIWFKFMQIYARFINLANHLIFSKNDF